MQRPTPFPMKGCRNGTDYKLEIRFRYNRENVCVCVCVYTKNTHFQFFRPIFQTTVHVFLSAKYIGCKGKY